MHNILDAILAPLARLAVARGVLFGEVAERLKWHYVRGAGAETDSRVSVMTGLQRRDVARLRGLPPDAAPRPVNHLSRLVARWLADPALAGQPLPRKDGPRSFDGLAASIRRDVHPRTMLDQLLAAGTVTLGDDDRVTLIAPSYQPLAGTDDQLDYLAANTGDHLAAAVANVLSDSPPFFDRAVHYSHLSPTAVAELKVAFDAGQTALLQTLNARAAQLQNTAPGSHRFRAGGYFYTEEDQ